MRYLVGLIAVVMVWAGGWIAGNKQGIAEGLKKALNTNPVSEELELTCAGLWVGEQNKKAAKK